MTDRVRSADWLTKQYEYERPLRGQVREGVVLKLDKGCAILDLGLKRDGFAPKEDVDRLEAETTQTLALGNEVLARVITPIDRDDFVLVSLYQALAELDWRKAEEMRQRSELWRGTVVGYNRGGLLIDFGRLRAFLPYSLIWGRNLRSLSSDDREGQLRASVGREVALVFIEADKGSNRLVVSERLARKQERSVAMERLLYELMEGDVVQGTVTNLTHFGAFVDLGGADGLIHISELTWHHVQNPAVVVQVGDRVRVYVLGLDRQKKRIGLSLKRLQPDPWPTAAEQVVEDALVSGEVVKVTSGGALVFVPRLGVDGFVHLSELAEPAPPSPSWILSEGEEVLVRVMEVDPYQQRLRLSLKRVREWERENWLAERAGQLTGAPLSDEG